MDRQTVTAGHVYSHADSCDKQDEGCVPLPLGLAAYCILVDCFGGSKGRGRRHDTRHAGRVSMEYGVSPSHFGRGVWLKTNVAVVGPVIPHETFLEWEALNCHVLAQISEAYRAGAVPQRPDH